MMFIYRQAKQSLVTCQGQQIVNCIRIHMAMRKGPRGHYPIIQPAKLLYWHRDICGIKMTIDVLLSGSIKHFLRQIKRINGPAMIIKYLTQNNQQWLLQVLLLK